MDIKRWRCGTLASAMECLLDCFRDKCFLGCGVFSPIESSPESSLCPLQVPTQLQLQLLTIDVHSSGGPAYRRLGYRRDDCLATGRRRRFGAGISTPDHTPCDRTDKHTYRRDHIARCTPDLGM